jgi:heterogeneous nuclear ribonucleoprotein U-like protein 1
VPGLLHKNNYGERFDRLMDRATVIFNTLLTRAANIPRNYIIDQTNVYKNARIRKLRPFSNYRKVSLQKGKYVMFVIWWFHIKFSIGWIHWVCNARNSCVAQTAVVVFPLPSELESRMAKRFSEMGKEVPAEAVNDMTGIQSHLSFYSITDSLVENFT